MFRKLGVERWVELTSVGKENGMYEIGRSVFGGRDRLLQYRCLQSGV